MNQDTFETLFGIDHERLTQAGEEIRTGQGQSRRAALRRRCRVGGPEPGTEDASAKGWTSSSSPGARIRGSTRPWPSFAKPRRS